MNDEPPTPQDLALALASQLRARTISHPWSTLAAAGSVGYVLGAGLPAFAVRWGAQLALRTLTTTLVAELGERVKNERSDT